MKSDMIPPPNFVLQPNQKGLKFYADKGQAKIVFDKIISRLRERGNPYDFAHVPQANQFLPDNLVKGSKEHAIFLFVLCLWMRGSVESTTTTIFLKELHEKKPEIFNPSLYEVSSYSIDDTLVKMVKNNLAEYLLGQQVNENARGWVYNMRKLARHWEGDPRKIMDDKPGFDILTKRIKGKTLRGSLFINEDSPNGFMYFREKMVAMLAYFLMDAELVPMFYTPVPVDFHVLRLLTANLVLRVEGKSIDESIGIDFLKEGVLKEAREVTEWYCREYKISPIALCDALWLLSGNLCRKNPGNSGRVVDRKRQNDARAESEKEDRFFFDIDSITDSDDLELKGRKKYQGLKFSEDDLNNKAKIILIQKACGRCPLNQTCRFNISAGAYYVRGVLVPERLRVQAPDHSDHFLDHPEFRNIGSRPDPTIRYTKISFSD